MITRTPDECVALLSLIKMHKQVFHNSTHLTKVLFQDGLLRKKEYGLGLTIAITLFGSLQTTFKRESL